MNDNTMNIKNIKLQLKNIESQFDNVEIQMNSMMPMNIDNQIENLGIQMLNLGIQTLNILNNMLKSLSFNYIAFNEKIENIITQIQKLKSPIGMNPMENMNNMGMGMMGMNDPSLLNPPMMMNMMNMNMDMSDFMPMNPMNNDEESTKGLNVYFKQNFKDSDHPPVIEVLCFLEEKISDIIRKYRIKSNDSDKKKNLFIMVIL